MEWTGQQSFSQFPKGSFIAFYWGPQPAKQRSKEEKPLASEEEASHDGEKMLGSDMVAHHPNTSLAKLGGAS